MKVLLMFILLVLTSTIFAQTVSPTQKDWIGIQNILRGKKSSVHIAVSEFKKLMKLQHDGYVLQPLKVTKIGTLKMLPGSCIWLTKGFKPINGWLIFIQEGRQNTRWVIIRPPAG